MTRDYMKFLGILGLRFSRGMFGMARTNTTLSYTNWELVILDESHRIHVSRLTLDEYRHDYKGIYKLLDIDIVSDNDTIDLRQVQCRHYVKPIHIHDNTYCIYI